LSPPTLSHLLLHLLFSTATATTQIYTLSLHDALPISASRPHGAADAARPDQAARGVCTRCGGQPDAGSRGLPERPPAERRRHRRSEEHTSELQSLTNIVCRLLLGKKKHNQHHILPSDT